MTTDDRAGAPAVSILVPSYNYAAFLAEALEGIRAQTRTDWECLVADDGSADDSPAVAASFAARDPRFRVLAHPGGGNRGLAATLALGLSQARGAWTAFLESDDLWRADCLERRLETARASGADVVFNDVEPLVMPGADRAWFDGSVPRIMRRHAARPVPFHPVADFLAGNVIPTFSCAMARTDLLRSLSWDSPVPRWLDWHIWAQAARTAAFAFVPEKLSRWRLHAGSWNSRPDPAAYLRDFSRMGRNLRRLCLPSLRREGRWGWMAFLFLPAPLRLLWRLAPVLARHGIDPILRRLRPAAERR